MTTDCLSGRHPVPSGEHRTGHLSTLGNYLVCDACRSPVHPDGLERFHFTCRDAERANTAYRLSQGKDSG